MVAMIRPTLLLKMDLDESVYSEDVAAEIRRSYSYVSPALVEHHAAGEYGSENTIRFIVKMRQPYWSSTEEGADDLWNTVMLKWLENMFTKISSTAASCEALSEEEGGVRLHYSWLDVEFGDAVTVSIRLNEDSSIPQDAVEKIDAVRLYANEAAFGSGEVMRVRIPSRLSEQDTHTDEVIVPLEDSTDADAIADTADSKQGLVEAAESILPQHTIWGIEYRDGSIREFDSIDRAFVESRLV